MKPKIIDSDELAPRLSAAEDVELLPKVVARKVCPRIASSEDAEDKPQVDADELRPVIRNAEGDC